MTPPDLLSLTLPVRALDSGNLPRGALPPVGRAMQAILIHAARAADPSLTDLHTPNDLHPFTTSDLAGQDRRGALMPQHIYALRLTALSAPLCAALLSAATSGELRPGARIQLTDAVCELADSPLAPREISQTSYHDLALNHQFATLNAPREIHLWFASPTTFKRNGMHLPVPLPDLVFGSLLRKWNAFCPPSLCLPRELTAYAADNLALSRYELNTVPLRAKGNGLRVGCIGHVLYTDLAREPQAHAALRLLADFAAYAGVGAHTTIGLGQCFALDPDG